MQDPATAEISRAQVWQWLRHQRTLADGTSITRDLVREIERSELSTIAEAVGPEAFARGRYGEAANLFEEVAQNDEFPELLTLRALDHIDL